MTVRTIDEIFRDFVTDGVPASGPFNPHKPDIRDTLKALTEGSENFPDNRVIRLNNANEGTANNIVVTASVAIPAAAYQVLYILNVTQENTGPVTVSGAINRTLVTNTSASVPSGYLTPGMAVLCVDTGSALRMLSYGDNETIVRDAEAAQAAAEEAATRAETAAAGVESPVSYEPQTLTAAQKAQARENIGVGGTLASRAALKALSPSAGLSVFLGETGREGDFTWQTGDYSSFVTADIEEGIYVPSDSIAPSSGAWVRQFGSDVQAAWFGAVGDDTTDCNAAINAAITMATLLGRRSVVLPSGVVRHDGSINIGTGYIRIKGAGVGATTLRRTSLTDSRFVLSPDLDSVFISDMSLDVAGGAVVTAGAELYAEKASNLFLENMVISGGYHGIYLVGCFEVHLTKVVMTYGGTSFVDQRGVFIQRAADGTRSGNIFIDGCSIKTANGQSGSAGAQSGLFVDVVDGLFVSNSYFGYFGFAAISITNQVNDYLTGIHFSNCWFDFASGSGAVIAGATGTNCSNIKFTGCTFLGGSNADYALNIDGNAFNVSAVGCTFSWVNGDLIRVNTTGTGICISDNRLLLADNDNNGAGNCITISNTAGAVVMGNQIDGQSKAENGIAISGGSRVVVTGNTVYSCVNGVLTSGTLNYYVIRANILFGNSGSSLVDSASGANKSVGENI